MSDLPGWEQVLTAASHPQRIVPNTVLVGGTAAALYARHRRSADADHTLSDLREHFDDVLRDLESVSGWTTARQLIVQLANPRPYDREETDLTAYKALSERYDSWTKLERIASHIANALFHALIGDARDGGDIGSEAGAPGGDG